VKPEMSKGASEVSLTNVGFLSATELTFLLSVVPLSFSRPLKKGRKKPYVRCTQWISHVALTRALIGSSFISSERLKISHKTAKLG